MDYLDLYDLLEAKVNPDETEIEIDEFVTVQNQIFTSKNWDPL